MSDKEPTEGRRIGVHPLIVVFGVIFGLWLFVTLIIPKSKNSPTHGPGASQNAEAPLPGIMSSDLVPSFTITGNTVEAEHISGSGTVNRYVRLAITQLTGSALIVCSFARN